MTILLVPQDARPQASPLFVAPGHRVYDLIDRLHGLGLIPDGHEWGSRSRTRGEIYELLLAAQKKAESAAPEVGLVVGQYIKYLEIDYLELRSDSLARNLVSGVQTTLVAGHHEGDVRTGTNVTYAEFEGPTPRASEVKEFLGAVTLFASPAAGAVVEGGHFQGRWGVSMFQANAAFGPAVLWIGRRHISWGTGNSSMIFSGSVPFDGGGVDLLRPLFLPSFLKALGPVRFETFLSQISENGILSDAWLWGARGSIAPHPRVVLAATRGAMFGGTGNEPITLRDLAYVIMGKHGSGGSNFENQIASITVSVRPPVPSLPLSLQVEWGMEDSAGSWWDVPGVIAKVQLHAIPSMPAVALHGSYVHFSESCCGNPPWYRHMAFLEGWSDRGNPLGHPLGGHGTEVNFGAVADLIAEHLWLSGLGFVRSRGRENLYAPDRAGNSVGAQFGLATRPTRGIELQSDVFLELGAGDWAEFRASFGLQAQIHALRE